MSKVDQQNLPSLIQAVAPYINEHGYLAVGLLVMLEDFGVPVPGETTLIAAAVFAAIGQLNIFVVAAVAFVAAVIGDNIGFAIGQYGGRRLLDRWGKYVFLTPKRLDEAEAFFNRHGGKVVVVARFVEGLRQANGLIAGISEMRWRSFLVFNAIGAALWVAVWSSVGYYAGDHIRTMLKYQLYFTITIAVLIAAFIGRHLYKHWRSKQKTSE